MMHNSFRIRLIALVMIILITGLFAQTASAQAQTYTVRPGDTLQAIANFFDTTVEAIALANNIANTSRIYTGQVLTIPAPGTGVSLPQRTYTVQRGDTLASIAARNNTTIEAIQQYNVIADPNNILAGEVLNLPPVGGPVVQTTTATTTTTVQQPAPLARRVVNGRYLVQEGDTLFAISRSFNVDAWSIARANGILNLNKIYFGQWLIIPGY